jgi:hypothetical protein
VRMSGQDPRSTPLSIHTLLIPRPSHLFFTLHSSLKCMLG